LEGAMQKIFYHLKERKNEVTSFVVFTIVFIVYTAIVYRTNLIDFLSVRGVHLSVAMVFFFGSLALMHLLNVLLTGRMHQNSLRVITLAASIALLIIIYAAPIPLIINNFMGIAVISGVLFFFSIRK
jgi:hypothetical protein